MGALELASPEPDGQSGDRLARKNALILAVAQALAGGNAAVVFATGGIVGAMLAPDRSLATIPLTSFVLGQWAGTLPVGYLSRRFGRRTTFLTGTIFGALMGLLGCFAVLRGSFGLYLVATFSAGLYAAACQAYRFAAADTASEGFKPRAVSWVFMGGLFAAFVGPQLVIHTKDFWPPYLFAASYLGQAAIAVIAAGVLTFVRIPIRAGFHPSDGGRPLGMIAAQPKFIVAVTCGVASYALMNLVMTAAPLAMVDCAHSVSDATLGIQWHVLAMYGPSLLTGPLLSRYGPTPVIAAGLLLIAVSAVVGMAGVTLAHFWIALILLGVGWNFGFLGATTLVMACHRPSERTRVQALNDFLVFGSMAIGSFASGTLLATFGWISVNAIVLPITAVAGALLLWLVARRPSPA